MSSVEDFRTEVRSRPGAHPTGEFATLKGRGGPGREHEAFHELLAAGTHGDPYELDDWQRLFLLSRADTVYAGSDQIQRTLIAERILGLPKEVRA